MAKLEVVTCDLSADTKRAMRVAKLLMPMVWLRVLSVERAVAIAMRFVKVDVVTERTVAQQR